MLLNLRDYPRDQYAAYWETIISQDKEMWTVRLYSFDSGSLIEEQSGLGGLEAAHQFIESRMSAHKR